VLFRRRRVSVSGKQGDVTRIVLGHENEKATADPSLTTPEPTPKSQRRSLGPLVRSGPRSLRMTARGGEGLCGAGCRCGGHFHRTGSSAGTKF